MTGLHSRAMTSPCGKIRIPINESADDRSQIEEYLAAYHGEGIQHIALDTEDIHGTVEALRARGIAFMDAPPDSYYEAVDATAAGARRGPRPAAAKRHSDRRLARTGWRPPAANFHADGNRADLLRDNPAQGRRGVRRGQFPSAVRGDGARPGPPRHLENLKSCENLESCVMNGDPLTHDGNPADDFVISQELGRYTTEDHAIWRRLFERQSALLPGRACPEYLDGLAGLGVAADGIPDFERLSDILDKSTGWRIVAVPGLVPGRRVLPPPGRPALSRRPTGSAARADGLSAGAGRLPRCLRPRAGADEPGLRRLHAGLWARRPQGAAPGRAAEAGAAVLVHRRVRPDPQTDEGLRIYGSGIVSSRTETRLLPGKPEPKRIAFDLLRIMRTDYRIDDLQDGYFVIDDFAQLFDATRPDFTPYYEALTMQPVSTGYRADGDVLLRETRSLAKSGRGKRRRRNDAQFHSPSPGRRASLPPGPRRPAAGHLRARAGPRGLLRPGDAHDPHPSADPVDRLGRAVAPARLRSEPRGRARSASLGGGRPSCATRHVRYRFWRTEGRHGRPGAQRRRRRPAVRPPAPAGTCSATTAIWPSARATTWCCRAAPCGAPTSPAPPRC